MTRLRPSPRSLAWIVDGDADATLAKLAETVDAGRLDAMDRIRAVWWLRRLTDALGPIEAAHRLRDRLDPHGRIPAAPDIVGLRFWVEAHARNLPYGALGRLARLAGLWSADVGRFRAGGSLTAEKVERLSAALIAAGAETKPNPNAHQTAPNFTQERNCK
jgi:hypothetical protein